MTSISNFILKDIGSAVLSFTLIFLLKKEKYLIDTRKAEGNFVNNDVEAKISVNLSNFNKVILIGIDGLGRFHKEAKTPNIKNFMLSGIHWPNTKAIIPTDSAQNWGSILTGVTPEKHKLNHQELEKGIVYENELYPSIFRLLNSKYPNIKLISYAAWGAVNNIIEKSVSSKVELYSPLTHENKYLSRWIWIKHHILNSPIYDRFVLSTLLKHIRNSKNNEREFIFVHFTDIDEQAHIHGFRSPRYFKQVRKIDSYLSSILYEIEKNENWKRCLIIITTDHGGINKISKKGKLRGTHGGDTNEETEVFLAISGNGIKASENKKEIKNIDCFAIIIEVFDTQKLIINDPLRYFDAKSPF